MRKIRFIAVLLILCMMTAVIPQVMSAEENAEAYYGDVNFDGKISTLDAALILKFSASMIIFTVDKELALTGEGFMKADANKDGQVNTADAAFVLKVCAGMISPNAVADGNAEYVITYSSGSISESAATVPAPQTVKAGETFVIMTVAVAQGHEFLGWLADFDGRMYTVGGSFVMPAQDVTLTARWDNESAPTPTSQLTNEPTQQPTDEPTQQPTATPTQQPTSTPTQQPTSTPVPTPTQIPIPDPHNWDGVWDAGQKPRGSGTVVDPYVIYLPEELVWMAYNTAQHDPDGDGMTGMAEAWSYNQHFKLGRDIVLNEQVLDENGNLLTGVTLNEWRGIGYENGWGDVRFCGEFNGDGHTIYGLYTTKQYCSLPEISDTKYSGFFISLGDSANVHDVNFVDAYVGSQSTYYTGGAVAYTESNVTVANITYQGFVQGGDSTASIGGILGRIETQNGMVQIMNCKFSGTVRGYRCGTTMDYCGGVGGILGTASLALAPAKEVWIDGCESTGKVAFSLGVMNTSTPYAALGGIAGKLRVEGATITNCRSDALITVPGEVTSSTDGGFINLGGILGYAHTGAISVKSCAFKGHVYGSYYGLGGIVGNSVSTGTTYLSIENCYNVGTIENFHGDSWKTVKFMGGIIGKASESVTITNCYNAGEMKVKVTSASYKTIGEISYQGLGSISNCYYLVGNTDCTITDSSKVHPKTAEEFMTLAASLGNEFVDDAESGRPVLKWELGKNAVDNPW